MRLLEVRDKNGNPFSIPANKVFRITPNDEGEGTLIYVDTGSKQIFYIASEPYGIVLKKFESIPENEDNTEDV